MHISGADFKLDASLVKGNRVKSVKLWSDGSEIDKDKMYYVAVPNFVAVSRDGFVFLKEKVLNVEHNNVQRLTDQDAELTLSQVVALALERFDMQAP